MNHEVLMQRCLDLAGLGTGMVSPNPLVGSVLYYNGVVIGEGYHHKAGEPHAEVNAIQSVADPSLLSESTLYVNLEPCSHFGKTPPCSNLIIEKGIRKVVIAHQDPFSQVNGQGINRLRNAGIEVTLGVMEKEALELNRRFLAYHALKRPYIILKWARTRDGFMDIDRQQPGNNQDNWITGKELKILVHKWRSEEDAILVGTHTARNDNPKLNVRDWTGRNPLRLIIDEHRILNPDLHIFDQSQPTIIYTSVASETLDNLEYRLLDFTQPILNQILDDLYRRQIQSLIVEGGRELLDHFIQAGLWDEARILTGDKYFITGLKAPDIEGNSIRTISTGKDHLQIIRNPHGYHQDI